MYQLQKPKVAINKDATVPILICKRDTQGSNSLHSLWIFSFSPLCTAAQASIESKVNRSAPQTPNFPLLTRKTGKHGLPSNRQVRRNCVLLFHENVRAHKSRVERDGNHCMVVAEKHYCSGYHHNHHPWSYCYNAVELNVVRR